MFNLMGFGYAPDDPTPAFSNVELVGETWRHSGMLMADVLGLPIDRIENFRNVLVTDRELHVAAGVIPAGTVGAMNFGVRVISGGKVRIVLQHFTRMADHLAPDWPQGHGWIVELEGEPSISARVEIGTEGSIMPTDDACMATAMHAIHAVPYVIAAKPGILTLADAPPMWGKDAFHVKAKSKSGLGAQDLLLKHPDLFAAAASWDFPADMASFNQFGASSADQYGTDANFQTNYRLTPSFLDAHKAPFTSQDRIWIGGFEAFETDVSDYDALLTSEGIAHTVETPQLMAHDWDPGWMSDALASLSEDGSQMRADS
jgi:hypothetical protein